jgi:hypothetical protein
MDCIYSDDAGETWSSPQTIPMERSPHDNPDQNCPSNWIVWQKPLRDRSGKWFTGFTRWVSPAVRHEPPNDSWMSQESVVEFMRFENIDDHPEPEDIRITYSAWGEQALRVPHYLGPEVSIAQEPSLVYLPDGRLFCLMRTLTGYIWFSISEDDGMSWCNPRPLLRRDKGAPIAAPLCCTPIYRLFDGRYVLIHQNNTGRIDGKTPEESAPSRQARWPACVAVGEFRLDAEQPVWFSESRVFMTHDGHHIGPARRLDLGVYCSMTHRSGNDVLWHPDRKFFLLGKRITPELLKGLTPPDRIS